MMKYQKGFAVQGFVGLFMFFGLAYIVVNGLILEPMQAKKEAAWHAFGDAQAVQTLANMKYYPKDIRNLEKPFTAGMPALGMLNTRAQAAGISLEMGYPKNSIGHALSLSNKVLTGNTDPVILSLGDMREELNEKENRLGRAAR